MVYISWFIVIGSWLVVNWLFDWAFWLLGRATLWLMKCL